MPDQTSDVSPKTNGQSRGTYAVTSSGQVRVRVNRLADTDAFDRVGDLYERAAAAVRKRPTNRATPEADEAASGTDTEGPNES